MRISVLLVPFRPTAAELLKHKFFTKAKVGFTYSLWKQTDTFSHYPFLYWWESLTISCSSRTTSICRRSSSWKARQYRTDPGRSVYICKCCVINMLEYTPGICEWDLVGKCCSMSQFSALNAWHRCGACPAPAVASTRLRTAAGSGATTSWMRRARRARPLCWLCGWDPTCPLLGSLVHSAHGTPAGGNVAPLVEFFLSLTLNLAPVVKGTEMKSERFKMYLHLKC